MWWWMCDGQGLNWRYWIPWLPPTISCKHCCSISLRFGALSVSQQVDGALWEAVNLLAEQSWDDLHDPVSSKLRLHLDGVTPGMRHRKGFQDPPNPFRTVVSLIRAVVRISHGPSHGKEVQKPQFSPQKPTCLVTRPTCLVTRVCQAIVGRSACGTHERVEVVGCFLSPLPTVNNHRTQQKSWVCCS